MLSEKKVKNMTNEEILEVCNYTICNSNDFHEVMSDFGILISKFEQLIEKANRVDELEEIIKKHELNIMPQEIKRLKESLNQEQRNVLDLSRIVNDNAKYTELGKALEKFMELKGAKVESDFTLENSIWKQLRFESTHSLINWYREQVKE